MQIKAYVIIKAPNIIKWLKTKKLCFSTRRACGGSPPPQACKASFHGLMLPSSVFLRYGNMREKKYLNPEVTYPCLFEPGLTKQNKNKILK